MSGIEKNTSESEFKHKSLDVGLRKNDFSLELIVSFDLCVFGFI